MHRRPLLGALASCGLSANGLGLIGCSTAPARRQVDDWTERLRGDTVALLGEVHDHPELHLRRRQALASALAAGWRPTVVLETFDTDRQDDLRRALRERPRDVDHLIATAGSAKGWDWPLYRPLLEALLQHDLPLVAGNLSRPAANRVVREGYGAVFDAAALARLGLDRAPPDDLRAGQAREIEDGHCGMLPARLVEPMSRAQFARDAVMADRVAEAAAHGGVVLIAGNGHVRRDLGVPRWLPEGLASRLLVVGFVEAGAAAPGDGAPGSTYDAQVQAPPLQRRDPCEGMTAPSPAPRPTA